MLPAVHVAATVVLVIERPHHARHRSAAQLVAAVGRPGIVDDRIGVRDDSAHECDPSTVGRPLRVAHAVVQRAQLLGRTCASDVEDEELIRGADPADEGDVSAVG